MGWSLHPPVDQVAGGVAGERGEQVLRGDLIAAAVAAAHGAGEAVVLLTWGPGEEDVCSVQRA